MCRSLKSSNTQTTWGVSADLYQQNVRKIQRMFQCCTFCITKIKCKQKSSLFGNRQLIPRNTATVAGLRGSALWREMLRAPRLNGNRRQGEMLLAVTGFWLDQKGVMSSLQIRMFRFFFSFIGEKKCTQCISNARLPSLHAV